MARDVLQLAASERNDEEKCKWMDEDIGAGWPIAPNHFLNRRVVKYGAGRLLLTCCQSSQVPVVSRTPDTGPSLRTAVSVVSISGQAVKVPAELL